MRHRHELRAFRRIGEMLPVVGDDTPRHFQRYEIGPLGIGVGLTGKEPDIGAPDIQPFQISGIFIGGELPLLFEMIRGADDLVGADFGTESDFRRAELETVFMEGPDEPSVLMGAEADCLFAVSPAGEQLIRPDLLDLFLWHFQIFCEFRPAVVTEAAFAEKAVRLPVRLNSVASGERVFQIRQNNVPVIRGPVVDCHRAGRRNGVIPDWLPVLVQIVGVCGFFLHVHEADPVSVGDTEAFRRDEAYAVFPHQTGIFRTDS